MTLRELLLCGADEEEIVIAAKAYVESRVSLFLLPESGPLNVNEYRCSSCGDICVYGWTEEEAIEEANLAFPGVEIKDCAIVCDDCYSQIMGVENG